MLNKQFFTELDKVSNFDRGDLRPLLNEMRETLGYFIQTYKFSDEQLEEQLATIVNDKFEASVIRERMHKAMPRVEYTEAELRIPDNLKNQPIIIKYI